MSLITRCPACGTMFKVVPDQLRISEGWVRCGHCAEIFDATAQLKSASEITAPPSPARSEMRTAGTDSSPKSQVLVLSPTNEAANTPSATAYDSPSLKAQAKAPVPQPLEARSNVSRQDTAKDLSASRAESVLESELDDVSFVREAKGTGIWARPVVRAMLWIALLGLSVLLVLQIALHDRDRLAATAPALRPWLAKLCEPLRCRIGPPRQIDMLAIDSSSFNKLRGDSYRLNVTLKNQATMQLAMPALELTLTDSQDQPLVRRVLMPHELGLNPGVIAAASEWSGSIALAVTANGIGAPIAGYRLLVFYP